MVRKFFFFFFECSGNLFGSQKNEALGICKKFLFYFREEKENFVLKMLKGLTTLGDKSNGSLLFEEKTDREPKGISVRVGGRLQFTCIFLMLFFYDSRAVPLRAKALFPNQSFHTKKVAVSEKFYVTFCIN